MRGFSKSADEGQDVKRAQETVEAIDQQITDLNTQFQADTAELENKIDPLTEVLETLSLKPKKTDIQVQLTTLTWVPYWQDEQGNLTPAW
jgi:conjugal transfer/entry exclusion protein